MARVVNASKNVQEQRMASLQDEYIEVKQRGSSQALFCREVIELHHDNGSILVAHPGDWVIEKEDGTAGVIPAAVFVDFYEPASERAAEVWADAEQAARPPENNDTGEFIPFSGEPDPREGGTQVDASGLAEHERGDARAAQAQLLEQLNAELRTITGAAVEQGVITESEAAQWRDSGEAPEGVQVTREGADYVVTREPGHDQATQTGPADVPASTEGDPAEVAPPAPNAENQPATTSDAPHDGDPAAA